MARAADPTGTNASISMTAHAATPAARRWRGDSGRMAARWVPLADEQTRTMRLGGAIGNLLGLIAVALAGIGIYGAMAASMRERGPEFGIRMALGARRCDVAWLIVRHGLGVLVAGWMAGCVVMAVVAPLVVASLFGVTPLDRVSFLVASGMVGLGVLTGIVEPAVRAGRLEPARALRG